MNVRISIRDGADQQLWQLYEWLSLDLNIKNDVDLGLAHKKTQGQMGVDLASIDAIVSNVLALASLIVSIAAWRGASRPTCTVTMRCGEAEVVIDAKVEDVEGIVAVLLAGNDDAQDVAKDGSHDETR